MKNILKLRFWIKFINLNKGHWSHWADEFIKAVKNFKFDLRRTAWLSQIATENSNTRINKKRLKKIFALPLQFMWFENALSNQKFVFLLPSISVNGG